MSTIAEALRDATEAAADGKRVIVCGRSGGAARSYFLALAGIEEVKQLSSSMRRSAGAERIEFPTGGRIVFVSVAGSGMRGHSADVVYLDDKSSAEPYIKATVLASSGGEVRRYTL